MIKKIATVGITLATAALLFSGVVLANPSDTENMVNKPASDTPMMKMKSHPAKSEKIMKRRHHQKMAEHRRHQRNGQCKMKQAEAKTAPAVQQPSAPAEE